MKGSTKKTIITVVALIMLFVIKQFNVFDGSGNTTLPTGGKDDVAILALLTDKQLVYTKHALCRMDCRRISKAEIKAILKNGRVNWRKSEPADRPCPSYALEGNTSDGQSVRIVFADCPDATKVITGIDLKQDYKCYCP